MRYSLKTLMITTALIAVSLVTLRAVKRKVDPYDGRNFSQSDWKANKNHGEDRSPMCGDLIRKHLQPGMTKFAVIRLLGDDYKSLNTKVDAGHNHLKGVETLAYNVGASPWNGYDDAWLYVHIDKHNNVISAKVDGY